MGTYFIGHEIFRRSSYGAKHPLAIPRVSTLIDLCRALNWLPDDVYLTSPTAEPADLERFHDADYVAAVQRAEREQKVSEEEAVRYALGRHGNPIFPEIYTRPATACGGSLLAVDLLCSAEKGIRYVYNPAGGTHHGLRGQASGFCYFNDPALAILALLDRGFERVLYIDIDAHHGDGVQIAFRDEPRVTTISIHESGRWPMVSGGLGDVGDRGGGGAINLPVPAGFNDNEMDYLREAAILPLVQEIQPQIMVFQGGADALEDDPLSKLGLSNLALWRVLRDLRSLAPKLLLLGGGGYNPWSVARCWAGFWSILRRIEVPEILDQPAERVLRDLTWRHSRGRNPPEHWYRTLQDNPRLGPIREEVKSVVAKALEPFGRCVLS